MKELGANVNLIVCQKSKLRDWIEHFKQHYGDDISAYDLSKPKQLKGFIENNGDWRYRVGIINYDLAFRRPQLMQLKDFTLMLDESSLIQNETAKRSKFILKLEPKNVILLSGTPVSGRYEALWSQCRLLGWDISKDLYWRQYIETEVIEANGFPLRVVTGYKNVERLKNKLRKHGAIFMKSNQVFDLPEQIFNTVSIPTTKDYRKFKKDRIVKIGEVELIGDTTLTKMLRERQLCGQYNNAKLQAFADLVESTNDRLIVFYNFTEELGKMLNVIKDFYQRYRVSIVNGKIKDLIAYEQHTNSITFVQYAAGSKGLNLQKANKMIYFTPPLSVDNWMQSQKRVHRIGQDKTCFYYKMVCKNSIEEKIYDALERGVDFTDALFVESEK